MRQKIVFEMIGWQKIQVQPHFPQCIHHQRAAATRHTIRRLRGKAEYSSSPKCAQPLLYLGPECHFSVLARQRPQYFRARPKFSGKANAAGLISVGSPGSAEIHL